ncbi:MAG TPA: PKD domain-containing protein [Solirubrobacterales bacterium]|nr:PKD domain-containing protein [Solirubrobacterales bacterium]
MLAAISSLLAVGALASVASAAPTWLAPADLTPASESVVANSAFPPVPITAAGADAQGNVVAAWGRKTASGSVIEVAERPAGGSFTVTPLQAGTELAGDTALAVNASGAAVLAWTRQTADSKVWVSRRSAGGQFGAPVAIGSAAGADALSPEVDINDSGDIIVVWRQNVGGETIYAAYRPGGGDFSTQPVSTTDTWNQEPVVALANDGKATIVWSHWNGSLNIGRARVRAADGTLGTQRDLSGSQPTGGAIYPDLDVDAAGNAVAVWSHCRTPCNDISNGPFDVEGASRLAAADTWAPFAPFGTGPAPYGNLDPQVAVDQAGNAVAVWIAPNRSVQSASRAAGGGFGTPQTGISAPFAEGIRLAMDPQGNAVALWVRRDGAGGSGFLGACPCRIEAAAKPLGGVFGTVQTISPNLDSHAASLGVDGQGNALAVWAFDDPALPEGTDTVVQAAGYDAAPPTLPAPSVPATAFVGDAAPFSAAPIDVWSSVSVGWEFGDGQTGTGASLSHAFGSPGVFSVKATATDTVGNSASKSSTVTVSAKPVKRLITGVTNRWAPFKKYTKVIKLAATGVPAGGTVTITCGGKGCPFKSKKIKSAKGGKVNLVKLFNRKKKGKKKIAKLQVNTKVEIKITEPNAIGSFSVFTIRGGKNPSRVNGCLAADTNLKTACPTS